MKSKPALQSLPDDLYCFVTEFLTLQELTEFYCVATGESSSSHQQQQRRNVVALILAALQKRASRSVLTKAPMFLQNMWDDVCDAVNNSNNGDVVPSIRNVVILQLYLETTEKFNRQLLGAVRDKGQLWLACSYQFNLDSIRLYVFDSYSRINRPKVV